MDVVRVVGGETAEMPGFYKVGEYDLAGFAVGIVEKSQLLDGSRVMVGDLAVGLGSSGLHSNGYSLVRKIIETQGLNWTDTPEILAGETIAQVCLTPTRIYVKPVLEALKSGLAIHGMAHITGGGLPENLPRCLGKNQSIKIDPTTWTPLPIFTWVAELGQISLNEMFNTFNMGIGYVLIISPQDLDSAIKWFAGEGIPAYLIGEVIDGNGELIGLS
jgi:phosphoribosylformylglycinamidine cyclo-ligase